MLTGFLYKHLNVIGPLLLILNSFTFALTFQALLVKGNCLLILFWKEKSTNFTMLHFTS